MNKFILSFGLVIISLHSIAQQEPIFSQFWNTKTYYNPATTGLNYKHLITSIGRWQDVGVDGAPVTQLFGYAAKLKKLHGGLGFTYMHETIGFNTFNKTKFNYSYQINTKKEGVLSFGIGVGFNNLKFEPDWVTPGGITDPSLPTSFNETGFTADFGVAFNSKKFNIALSATQLTSSRIGDYAEKPHVVLMSDYLVGKDDGIQFKPQVFFMADEADYTYDFNAMLLWKQKIGAGVTLRRNESIGFVVNWDILKKFRIGYAYDLAVKTFDQVSKGSHTGYFGLVFNEAKKRGKKN
jgi:type IX secretion system PorP/SprF family membrane protein